MYKALDVASFIIHHEMTSDRTVDNMRLQKLLYFIQCIFFATRGKACFSETIAASEYGPMVPEVYRKYKIFGSTMIPDTKLQAVFNEQDASLMAAMLNTAARYSTKKLVQNAKSQAPWKTAYIPGMVCTIPEQAICQYAKRAYQ